MSAGVMMANLSWNSAKTMSGMVGASAGCVGHAHVREHEGRQRVADDAVDAVAERQAEPDHDPQDADDRHRHEALEHRRDDVLRADHPAVEEGEPRRHQQHQRRGRQHPGDVAAVNRPPGDRRRSRADGDRHHADRGEQEERQRGEGADPAGGAAHFGKRHGQMIHESCMISTKIVSCIINMPLDSFCDGQFMQAVHISRHLAGQAALSTAARRRAVKWYNRRLVHPSLSSRTHR